MTKGEAGVDSSQDAARTEAVGAGTDLDLEDARSVAVEEESVLSAARQLGVDRKVGFFQETRGHLGERKRRTHGGKEVLEAHDSSREVASPSKRETENARVWALY